MSDVTVKQLAVVLGMSVDKLLVQLDEAGMKFSSPDQVVSSTEKVKLLGFLRRTHGKREASRRGGPAPRKITLKRKTVSELTVNQGAARGKTVASKCARSAPMSSAAWWPKTQEVDPEREDALRKLQESHAQQRSRASPLQGAGQPPARRTGQTARGRRGPACRRGRSAPTHEAEAQSQRPEQAAPAERPAKADIRPRRARHTSRARTDDRRGRAAPEGAPRTNTPRPSTVRTACATRATTELRAISARSCICRTQGQHAVARSRNVRASRSSRRGQDRPRTAFSKPVAPMVREVPIAETILVSELAQKMAVKAAESSRC